METSSTKTEVETLYDIEAQIAGLLIEIATLEPGDLRATEAAEELAALRLSESQKLTGIARLISLWEGNINRCKAEIERLRLKADRWASKIDNLKRYVQFTLPYGYKWDDGVHAIKWKQTEAVDHDPLAPPLPEQYLRTKVVQEPNKTLIKQVIKEGGTVEGWHLKTNRFVYFD